MHGPVGLGDATDEEVDGGRPDLGAGRADGGESGREELGDLVVVRDDREVLRNGDAAREREVDERHRLGVGVHEERRRAVLHRAIKRGVDGVREVGAAAIGEQVLEVLRRGEAELVAHGLPACRNLS